MATFLVLPPRELLEHEITAFLARLLPGVPVPKNLALTLIELLGSRETYVVHREELPEGCEVVAGLCAAFGAEAGDRVVEVGPPRSGATATVRESVVSAVGAAR